MGRGGNFNQLKLLQKKFNKLADGDSEKFISDLAKELAKRLLNKVIKNTPTGRYDEEVNFTTKDGKRVSFKPHSGKLGGTLKRGWTAKTDAEARSGGKGKSSIAYAKSLPVLKKGSIYVIEVINPVTYASYFEFGHRKRNHKGWTRGRFVLTCAEKQLEAALPNIIQKRVDEYLMRCLNV